MHNLVINGDWVIYNLLKLSMESKETLTNDEKTPHNKLIICWPLCIFNDKVLS